MQRRPLAFSKLEKSPKSRKPQGAAGYFFASVLLDLTIALSFWLRCCLPLILLQVSVSSFVRPGIPAKAEIDRKCSDPAAWRQALRKTNSLQTVPDHLDRANNNNNHAKLYRSLSTSHLAGRGPGVHQDQQQQPQRPNADVSYRTENQKADQQG